jgi:uncharacterized protein (DUF1684 family)
MMSTADLLAVADWRRRIAELYAEVRREAAADPAAAHATWRAEREALYRGHAASPVPAGERVAFRALQWPYADASRSTAPLEGMPAPATGAEGPGGAVPSISFVPASVGAPPPLELVGHVSLALPGGSVRLPVLQLLEYAGGIFLPFGDATNGGATYGAGRYLLDTAKGADLGVDAGGALILDFNFAYQPSCAFDPRWACPLAPPEARLALAVEAGERIR